MRIGDYIRDDPLMGQKRDNKSGLQSAVQGDELGLWFPGGSTGRKICPARPPGFKASDKSRHFPCDDPRVSSPPHPGCH